MVFIFPNLSSAQERVQNANGNGLSVARDDSIAAIADTSGSDVDAPVEYEAYYKDFDVFNNKLTLIGDAVVKYKNITIEAGKIQVDWNTRTLTAEALVETLAVKSDSLREQSRSDSVEMHLVGYPALIEGSDRIVGERMEYNFDTGKGRMVRGRTQLEGGYYTGEQIKRVAPNVLNISRGTYTTCDLETHPHFHFWARRMKIIAQERVIAKPIVLYIGHVPVAILPFAMFPTQSGRRSGIVIPRYGQSAAEGRYLRDFGYYWAISDYMDAKLTADFFEKAGWLFKGNFNYALQYNFRGSVSGSLTRKNFADRGVQERRWDLRINHSQTLDKTSSLNASGTFMSDNSFYRDFSFNPTQRLSRTLISQATYSKRWTKARANISINVSENKDLDNGNIIRQLPQVTFYLGERRLFARKKDERKRGLSGRASSAGSRDSEGPRWYENIYLRYSSRAQSQFNRRLDTARDSTFLEERRSSVSHDIGLRYSSPGKIFGWLSTSQSLTIDEDWFDRERIYDDFLTGTKEQTRQGFFARHLFRYSASANTKLYGTFSPKIGPVRGLRHVVTPSVSFSYQPDFSDPKWGYFETVKTFDADSNIVEERRDRFDFQGGIGTPRGEIASLNFSVNNLFQMKTQSGENEKKIDLFSMNLSAGYNFAAEQKKLSSLRTSLNATPSRAFNVSLSMSHSPYVFDDSLGRETDRFLWAGKGFFGGKYFRLTNLSISSSIRLQGSSQTAGGGEVGMTPPVGQFDAFNTGQDRFEGEREFSGSGIPWRASLTFSYTLSSFNPNRKTKNAYLNIRNAEVSLTENWRVRFNGQIDLRKKQLVSQYWTFYRDLHCWEASLNWTPVGPSRGFYFRINVKAPHLRDLKIERRGGRSSIFGGSYY
jgi:lipopolysaccharide export system protein LptA